MNDLNEWEVMVIKTALSSAYQRINSCREMDMCEFLFLLNDIYIQKIIETFDCEEDCYELG